MHQFIDKEFNNGAPHIEKEFDDGATPLLVHDMLTQNLTLKLPREKKIGTRELKAKQKLWERKPMILKVMISLSAVKLVQYCIPL